MDKPELKKDNGKLSFWGFLLSVFEMVALPFIPIFKLLFKVIKLVIEAEFLTKEGKVNLAGLIVVIMGISAVAVSPLIPLFQNIVFGSYKASIDAPISWVFYAFIFCVSMILVDKWFSLWLTKGQSGQGHDT